MKKYFKFVVSDAKKVKSFSTIKENEILISVRIYYNSVSKNFLLASLVFEVSKHDPKKIIDFKHMLKGDLFDYFNFTPKKYLELIVEYLTESGYDITLHNIN